MTNTEQERERFEKWLESQDEPWKNEFRSADNWLWEGWQAAVDRHPQAPVITTDSNSVTFDEADLEMDKCKWCGGYHRGGCHREPAASRDQQAAPAQGAPMSASDIQLAEHAQFHCWSAEEIADIRQYANFHAASLLASRENVEAQLQQELFHADAVVEKLRGELSEMREAIGKALRYLEKADACEGAAAALVCCRNAKHVLAAAWLDIMAVVRAEQVK